MYPHKHILGQLLKKIIEWKWTEHTTAFENLDLKKNHGNTVFSTLQFQLPEYINHRRKH